MLKLSPAEYVIRTFGGVRATARALGRSAAAISKWRKPREEKGTGGQIPRKAMWELLAKSRELGLDLNPNDLLLGREVKE
jgi:hypothetical protein